MSDAVPEGYSYAPSPSAFPNHVGRIFHKTVELPGGEAEKWIALYVEDHHVNSWGMAHGGLIAFLAEVATSSAAWDPSGPPVVTISLTTQFLRAPKLGQLLEMRSQATRRTRSLVFVDAQAFADGELQFTATAVNKVIGGQPSAAITAWAVVIRASMRSCCATITSCVAASAPAMQSSGITT